MLDCRFATWPCWPSANGWMNVKGDIWIDLQSVDILPFIKSKYVIHWMDFSKWEYFFFTFV